MKSHARSKSGGSHAKGSGSSSKGAAASRANGSGGSGGSPVGAGVGLDSLRGADLGTLQRLAGNAAATQLHVQRSAMGDFAGTHLGYLTLRFNGLPVESDIRAEREVTPPGEVPGKFGGFAGQDEATALARLHVNATAVLQDPAGQFHVFDTKWPTITSVAEGYTVQPSEGKGFRFVRWVNLVAATEKAGWSSRTDMAHSLYRLWQAGGRSNDTIRSAAESIFGDLIQFALGVGPAQVHIVRGGAAKPGKYNFNLEAGDDAAAHGGVTGSVPTTLEGPLPAPSLELGPLAFHSTSPVPTYATVQHELAHVEHAAKAVSWVERWREAAQAGTTEADFATWLKSALKRSRISKLDFDIVMEQVAEKGGSNNTESLAYLAGFTAAYHLMDPADDALHLFKSLIEIGQVWPWANHAVQDAVVQRLLDYYASVMDKEHQVRFREFVGQKHAGMAEDAPARLFYGALL